MLNKLRLFIGRNKYEILVLSFLLLIFGDTPRSMVFSIILLPLQNMVVAMIVFFDHKKLRYAIGSMIGLTIAISLFNCCHFTRLGAGIILAIYFLYFIVISVKVYQKIFTTRRVSAEMMATVLCGFILLCLAGAILFITIEVNMPHSYSNVGLGAVRFSNLSYFSFTTLLTIGYGDIVPLSLTAKRSVMLMGITGHIYTVFLTGIIIGKYIQAEQANIIS
jgi:voltage-gated potassium channel